MRVSGWKVAAAALLCGVMGSAARAQLDDPAVAKQ